MKSLKHVLYWEDATKERMIYLELDARSWRLAEKVFGYRKQSSVYLYRHETSVAYFSVKDSKREAHIGYRFYSKPANARRVMAWISGTRRAGPRARRRTR